ncbi:hypothetical protein [Actinacidiphila yanglinensis]|uniref:hypothetical protein n=1 Tax=Actinacidiphila yanglinensis TaxID=310779 RepID=UPI00389940CF
MSRVTLTPSPLHPPDAEPEPEPAVPPRAGRRRDLAAAAAGLVLFAVVAVVGTRIEHRTGKLHAPWPPLLATWHPHTGPGTPAAVAVAVLAVAYGPRLAERLPWRALPWAAWGAAMAWTWSLALVDGWRRGVANRLTTRNEYLVEVPRFRHAGAALRDYTHHILIDSPGHWNAHVAGHPAAAVLTFVGLDRIGLGGGAWAGAFVITAGGSVAAAVLVALRALGAERAARAAAPFLVLTPGAVWVGASADGYFAAVSAWALALLALAVTARSRPGRAGAAVGSGLLLGLALYLSYGLTLLVVPVLALLWYARTLRPVPLLLLGLLVAPVCFTLAGFDWWEAYRLLKVRYYQGAGGDRPYSYWFFGDPATVLAAAGFASFAGVGRAVGAWASSAKVGFRGVLRGGPGEVGSRAPFPGGPGEVGSRAVLPGGPGGVGSGAVLPGALRKVLARLPFSFPSRPDPAVLLPCAMLLALLAADLSGMSKAETERIWLPFTLWLPATAALLPAPDRRAWLAAQAALALLLNHLLLTYW